MQKQKAFSLIELLVTVAIIGVATSIVLVAFSGNRNKRDVESAAISAAGKIREIQAASLTGRKHIQGTIPCSYRATWSNSNLATTYVYKDGSGNCTQVAAVSSYNLGTGVSFSGTGAADFSIPHARTASTQTILIQKGSASGVVCITVQGTIEAKANTSSC